MDIKKIDMIEEEYECFHCGAVSPVVSVHFEFENGECIDEITDLDESEVEVYLQERIKEENWTDLTDYGYGLYCPHCLESLE